MEQYIYLGVIILTFIASLFVAQYVVNPELKKIYIKKATPDITKEEMIQLENRLSEFLKENNLNSESTIYEVAHVLKVVDGGSVDNISSRARIYEPDVNGDFTVVHSKKVPNHEHLFDFAHELGHRINNDPLPANRPHGYNKPKLDQLADYTGAALLMPLEQVYTFLLKNEYNSASNHKRLVLIRKLSKKYSVSETLTVRRVNEVRLLKNMISK